ncbi:MAG TPA: methyltransferase domain-containing protein [Candidatus Binataceae bacterium]|nr:methyltransferase domain-containing protein [Candidatus Binataceae bacterium]
MKDQLVAAQERMLEYASDTWQLSSIPFRNVLDVGCGLGGGAIYWAQNFGAQVTAVTIAPSHVELVRKFANTAQVGDKVKPLLCEAAEVPGAACFDAAIAIDSSSSFPREPWLDRLARLLRPKGRLFIFDCFLVDHQYAEPFNHHWCAQIGTLDEYLAAAVKAGFLLQAVDDVSARAANFWTTTQALMRLEDEADGSGKNGESCEVHALVRQGLVDGGLRHLLLNFAKA